MSICSAGDWYCPDPAVSDTVEYWLRAFTTYLRKLYLKYKTQAGFPEKEAKGNEADLREKFVKQVDPEMKRFLGFLTRTFLSKDCWDHRTALVDHMKALRKEFPCIVTPMLGVLVELAEAKVASPTGVDFTHLPMPVQNVITSGDLHRRYLCERAKGLFVQLRMAHGMESAKRIKELDDLLLHPSRTKEHLAELAVARNVISDDMPQAAKIEYFLQDRAKIAILRAWAPSSELTFLSTHLGGSLGFSCWL